MPPALEQKIRDKSAVVGVIGLGYVGLPLIRAFIAAGYRTMGFDVDRTKVESLLAGRSYIGHIASEWIAECVKSGKFTPSADMKRLAEADALLDQAEWSGWSIKDIRAAVHALPAFGAVVIPAGRFGTIVVDPPWDMRKIEREVRPNQSGCA